MDGKSGNITVIRIMPNSMYVLPSGLELGPFNMFEGISDYGNKVTWVESNELWKWFYKTLGTATETHKYYNYYESRPEELI